MQKWEYNLFHIGQIVPSREEAIRTNHANRTIIPKDPARRVVSFEELGADGWEAACGIGGGVLFKRPLDKD